MHDVISPEYLGNSRQLTQLCRQKCHATGKVPAEITHQTREAIYCPYVLSPFSQSHIIVCMWGVWEENILKEPLNYSTLYVSMAYSIYVYTQCLAKSVFMAVYLSTGGTSYFSPKMLLFQEPFRTPNRGLVPEHGWIFLLICISIARSSHSHLKVGSNSCLHIYLQGVRANFCLKYYCFKNRSGDKKRLVPQHGWYFVLICIAKTYVTFKCWDCANINSSRPSDT